MKKIFLSFLIITFSFLACQVSEAKTTSYDKYGRKTGSYKTTGNTTTSYDRYGSKTASYKKTPTLCMKKKHPVKDVALNEA